MLSADDLLAGAGLTYEVEVPSEVLQPANGGNPPVPPLAKGGPGGVVRLRPLTVHDLQLISRAAKESDSLVATLMVQRSLIDPELSVPQVSAMHVGLVQFLLAQVNQISGITATSEQLSAAAEAPLAKAAFVLSREFGWTPDEVGELTLGQVLLHLQLLKEKSRP